ncbi:hypothetical protein HUO09_08615 [Vibrio sp. Y2-5]|uniref:hypothetical protein n=1 Tax=Vibrio sp. Y2-5 TaxID=2743977 RepID=UPI0016614302|nr:hypothetical protein [Vibrio sp. Y2-5]MBD0786408.1 hypothetical protein [Vibrio sp. Y2-5]
MREDVLNKLIEDIYTKIGRNVVLYQKLELLLKDLSSKNVCGYLSELTNKKYGLDGISRTKTLGGLIKDYPLRLETEHEVETSTPDDKDEAYISFKFERVASEEYITRKKNELSKLVKNRNSLIHHVLLEHDLKTVEGCKALAKILDQQAEEVRHEIEDFRLSYRAISQSVDMLIVIQYPILIHLVDITNKYSREDGWTLLSTSANILKQRFPKDYLELKASIGNRSLKSFLIETPLFILGEESLSSGGTRCVIKVRPKLSVTVG